MNYIFFGSPKFASIILEKLIATGFVPSAVICNPDRPVGRKKTLTPPLTKILAQKNDIPVFQPEKLEIGNWKLEIKKITNLQDFDFFVVAAYAQIIPKEIVELSRLGTVGVHPSLLPKYRGASPIQSAILNGEEKTGITLYLLDEKMDHGPILGTRDWPIGTKDNYENLLEKLAEVGGNILTETLPKFLKGEIKPQIQDENQATYAKKFKTEDAYIDPADLARAENEGGEIALQIDRKIRALNPEPGVWTMQNNKRLKLLETRIENGKLKLMKAQKEGEKAKNLVTSNK